MRDHPQAYNVRLELALVRDSEELVDAATARILQAIRDTGSLTEAARITGASYKGLWSRIKALEGKLGAPIVESVSGGPGGGWTKLTLLGESLLEDYQILLSRLGRYLRDEGRKPPDITIMGSHCPALELLVSILRSGGGPALYVKLLNVGSMDGVEALAGGWGDMAGVHLLDPKTGIYNLHLLEEPRLRGRAVLIRGYRRTQGLLLQKGNPKRVRGLADILRRDVTFINRNRGSGTRILLDHRLDQLARRLGGPTAEELRSRIRGYDVEARSHREVALAILNGRADVGVGLQCIAAEYGLSFIPLGEEHYDLLVRRERLRSEPIRAFIRHLRSRWFREAVAGRLPGIRLLPDTGRLLTPDPSV